MVRILGKRFGELSVEDVEQLVNEQRHEDRHLEYKRQLPPKLNDAIRKFVESIAALANTEGGVVIFGVEEEDHVPKQVVGLVDAVEDVENRRLESYAREHIDPGVTNLIPHWHDWRDGRKILILEVPRSLAAPHGIDGTFYGRQTGAKYPMQTNQLRQVFLERALWEQEAEDFRRARVEGFLSDTLGLLGTTAGPSLLVHILPLGGTREHDVVADTIDYNWDWRLAMARDLRYGQGAARRPNLHGWAFTDIRLPQGGAVEAALQFFRSGAVESYASMARFQVGDTLILGGSLERHIVTCIHRALEWLGKCDKAPPFIVYVTLFNVRQYRIAKVYPGDNGMAGFQQTMNYLPGLLVERVPASREELALVLRPTIDTVWQAAGSNQSPFYEGGRWHEQV